MLKSYLPGYYKDIIEIEELTNAEDKIFNTANSDLNQTLLNAFIITADLNTIKEYEILLGIIPSSFNLQERRQVVINRISLSNNFTEAFLNMKLDEILGKGNYKMWIDYNNYTLYVESSISNSTWYQELYITVNKIKPANIVFINRSMVYEMVLVNEEIQQRKRTFNYRLGTSWRLGRKPFSSIDDKGVVKVAKEMSVNNNLLDKLKIKTSEEIKYARLNNSYEIPDTDFIKKEVVEGNLLVEYPVPQSASLEAITKIELLDSSKSVLTEIQIYIVATEDIELKHIIKIEEGVNNA